MKEDNKTEELLVFLLEESEFLNLLPNELEAKTRKEFLLKLFRLHQALLVKTIKNNKNGQRSRSEDFSQKLREIENWLRIEQRDPLNSRFAVVINRFLLNLKK